MLGEVPATRLRLIERIVAAAAAASPGGRLSALAQQFLRAYYRGVAEEDLVARSPQYLAAAALHHLAFGRVRSRNRPLVSVFSPQGEAEGFSSPHTLAMIVAEDMPFLVDSLGIVFSRAGIGVHLIVHPVLAAAREPSGRLRAVSPASGTHERGWESWQLFEIDRQLEPARLEQLTRALDTTLLDVRAAVADWEAMRALALRVGATLDSETAVPRPARREAQALLAWMADNHFTFLGYRHYRLQRARGRAALVPDTPSGMGILRARRGVPAPRPTPLSAQARTRAYERTLLIITKANTVASVHRATYLDYVGVKTFNQRGQVTGEHRFLGLWTSSVYQLSPREIPVLRHKIEEVVERFGLAPDSHDAKAVVHVLETYPRDELFQASVGELVHIVRGVVNLYERDQVRLFLRRDVFRRFYSCLVYVPRDRYDTAVRARIEAILRESLHGRQVESQVQLSESTLARLHVVVRTDPAARDRPDAARIERAITVATTTWSDRLLVELEKQMDEASALAAARRWSDVFPPAYRADVDPAAAVADIQALEELGPQSDALHVSLHLPRQQQVRRIHLKIVKLGDPVPISDVLPMMENFGLRVIAERPYQLDWRERGPAWVQDFELEHRDGARIDIAKIEQDFRAAFVAVWRGEIDNDGFNRLLLAADLTAREIVVLRAYCRYLLQTGFAFSQAYIERVLAANPTIARDLFRLFALRFDPRLKPRTSEARAERLAAAIRASLEEVRSLDEDRILRGYLGVIRATLRTNYYQTDAAGAPKAYLCIKLDPQRLPDLPLPRPRFEVWVYSPRVEAVHLRMGEVARGGIRWSDRREDFRTEVLGLMKAQNVKNTVIVPVGAKGGFVVKRPPAAAAEQPREVIACYQTFMRGLLDITDNIVDGRIVPPPRVVRRDGDDPYLVVAADKGTASFSDIANALSLEYGFWLGDAFASGGSAGYDHKKMGITARGGWECVKRHFRELGVDIQRQDFTVAGIGDMSGDVFGNAMLLSEHIRLQAAFDHRHVFLDPDPDRKASLAERRRLFALPRSSWEDYDRRRISRGGGVFPRSAKSVTLSGEAQRLLSIGPVATPQEIIRGILKMPVDLIWNGGIGTYVKASGESNFEVGDRANDAVRINGTELWAKVVGEGGNLGLSQRGRIEYALNGGRLNTDFIDNSAGVNTSDVEVNIKILLNPQVAAGHLRFTERNRLLVRMTSEVAQLVLRNNYLQSQALSVLKLHAGERLPEYERLIRSLERSGELNRAVEFLPDDESLAERRRAGTGLSRPELAVVLSYGKIWLTRHLLESDVPEDAYLSRELERYFPPELRARFARAIARHRLRREIIVTAIANSLVNRMGPAFVVRTQEDTGADPARIARAYTAAREIFDMRSLWGKIEALDNRVPARLQYAMMFETARLLRHMTLWLLQQRRDLKIDAAVRELGAGVRQLAAHIAGTLTGAPRVQYEQLRTEHIAEGVPAELAGRVASLPALNAALDIVELAGRRARISFAAQVYFEGGARLGLDWLREQVEQLPVSGSWQAVARTELRYGVYAVQRRIAQDMLAAGSRGSAAACVSAWLAGAGKALVHWQTMLTEMRAAGNADFATLSVGLESVRKLVD